MDTSQNIEGNKAKGVSKMPFSLRMLLGGKGHDPKKPAEKKQHNAIKTGLLPFLQPTESEDVTASIDPYADFNQ